LHRLKRLLAEPLAAELLTLTEAHRAARNQSVDEVKFCRDFCQSRPADEINPPHLINGNDLQEMGMEPGPRFREMLEAVRDAQLDDKVRTREEALAFVRELAVRGMA
jgi:poly(A) polymerase